MTTSHFHTMPFFTCRCVLICDARLSSNGYDTPICQCPITNLHSFSSWGYLCPSILFVQPQSKQRQQQRQQQKSLEKALISDPRQAEEHKTWYRVVNPSQNHYLQAQHIYIYIDDTKPIDVVARNQASQLFGGPHIVFQEPILPSADFQTCGCNGCPFRRVMKIDQLISYSYSPTASNNGRKENSKE